MKKVSNKIFFSFDETDERSELIAVRTNVVVSAHHIKCLLKEVGDSNVNAILKSKYWLSFNFNSLGKKQIQEIGFVNDFDKCIVICDANNFKRLPKEINNKVLQVLIDFDAPVFESANQMLDSINNLTSNKKDYRIISASLLMGLSMMYLQKYDRQRN